MRTLWDTHNSDRLGEMRIDVWFGHRQAHLWGSEPPMGSWVRFQRMGVCRSHLSYDTDRVYYDWRTEREVWVPCRTRYEATTRNKIGGLGCFRDIPDEDGVATAISVLERSTADELGSRK